MTMQPIQQMARGLRELGDASSRVFALADFRGLLPEHEDGAFKSVVTRLEKRGDLIRVCRGIYILPDSTLRGSDLLGRTAARLRAGQFNYLSLETVLSGAGVISQIPMNRIILMSSGRSNVISCGAYGSIEFIHTRKQAADLAARLSYDSQSQLWRASVELALQDMKDTQRDTGLVNREAANEFI
jgi:predicted transcriptional regulator of viral defense system